MLNISENSIKKSVPIGSFESFRQLRDGGNRVFIKLTLAGLLVALLAMFLPWTQNIRAQGYVTTLLPDQRPQTIHSAIPGRIEKWYIMEGDTVKKGDTIIHISEVKEDYLDPELLGRTKKQVNAKEQSVSSYMEKVRSMDAQIDALITNRTLKYAQTQNLIQQARLKVSSDSMDFLAAETDYSIAVKQLERYESLYRDGIKSLTELEARRLKAQKAISARISAENQLNKSRNEVINLGMELRSVEADYRDKISKAEAEKFATLSKLYETEAEVTKLQNTYMNYSMRSGMYYITAPQDGIITKAIRTGIGELIKEGTEIVSIMPMNYNLAVSTYVRPIDLPLISKGQKVMIQFDGWPSIVFSGWPNSSYGTFSGRVIAIDPFISANNKYRILIAPDDKRTSWPEAIRVGTGARTISLINEVPLWYEFWRQMNGFPPDYYIPDNQKTNAKK